MFELLYSENGDQIVNKRRPFNLNLVYPIASLKQQIGAVKSKNLPK